MNRLSRSFLRDEILSRQQSCAGHQSKELALIGLIVAWGEQQRIHETRHKQSASRARAKLSKGWGWKCRSLGLGTDKTISELNIAIALLSLKTAIALFSLEMTLPVPSPIFISNPWNVIWQSTREYHKEDGVRANIITRAGHRQTQQNKAGKYNTTEHKQILVSKC